MIATYTQQEQTSLRTSILEQLTDSRQSEGISALPLDLLSTKHTDEILQGVYSPELLSEIEFQIEQSEALSADARCTNNAPFICYPDGEGRWRLVQGCCNDWLCPRCGHIRARQEFARIVAGAKTLADQGHPLYFWTLTCRGKEIPLEEAEQRYYEWTDRLLKACRMQAKRAGDFWAYCQVTERQSRQHPHSHLITTFLPSDAVLTHQERTRASGEPYSAEVFVSAWFNERNRTAGLGSQHRIEPVHNPVGLAAYVAKYLFKDCMTTLWPKGWKRIRYSRSWPKLPETASPEAFPIVRAADWLRVAALPCLVYADCQDTYERALSALVTNVIFTEKDERLLRRTLR